MELGAGVVQQQAQDSSDGDVSGGCEDVHADRQLLLGQSQQLYNRFFRGANAYSNMNQVCVGAQAEAVMGNEHYETPRIEEPPTPARSR